MKIIVLQKLVINMKNLIIIIVFVFTIVSCNTNFKPKSNLIIEGKSIGFINLGDKYDLSKKLPTIGCIVDKDSNCVELFTESKTFTTTKGIKIGNNVWVGAKVTFLDGTIIGNHCVVAAGAVVNGTYPDFSVIGGIPAKIIKSIK